GPLHTGRAGPLEPQQCTEVLLGLLHFRVRGQVRVIAHEDLPTVERDSAPVGQEHLAAMLIRAYEIPHTGDRNDTGALGHQGITFSRAFSHPERYVRIAKQRLDPGVYVEHVRTPIRELVLSRLAFAPWS